MVVIPLASILTIGAVVLLVLLPLILIGGLVVQESVLYQNLSQNDAELSGFGLLLENRTIYYIFRAIRCF